jgi:hypothetical protein
MIYILLFIITIEGYVIYNLLTKVERYERVLLNQSQLISYLSNTIYEMNVKLKEIDNKGTFESDDEVGFFFSELKQMQSTLNQFLETDVPKEKNPS